MYDRYQGRRLSHNQIEMAAEFIRLLKPDDATRAAVTQFMGKAAPYSSSLLSDSVAPTVWWSAGRRLGFQEGLVEVAEQLLTCSASSAGLERLFSTLKMTYGTLRSQLGSDKAGKLAFIYRALNKGK
jgi:hypothetical protein